MKPAEYADLEGEELIRRVMRDRDLSWAGAADTVMLWNRPEGDVIVLPDARSSFAERGTWKPGELRKIDD